MRLVLASGSPRRRDLLTRVGFGVDIRPQDVDESWDPNVAPIAHAASLASRKAAHALAHEGLEDEDVLVAADTVVHMDGRIFDKPTDRAQARAHLMALSGRVHEVTTGVCVTPARALAEAFTVTTTVRFRRLSEAEIDAYLATGEADDKAGAYGIQGLGGAFVAELHGSWTNVMGLPLESCLAALAKLGRLPDRV